MPINSIRIGKYLSTMNAYNQTSVMQNDTPNSLKCSGITSDMTKNGTVINAQYEMNMTNEKLAMGIQLKSSTA